MNIYLIGLILIVAFVSFMIFRKLNNKRKEKKTVTTNQNVDQDPSQGLSQDPNKEPTEEELKKMEENLQKILAYKLEDEEQIAQQLSNMTDQQMALYADQVAKKYADANDEKFLEAQMPADVVDKLKQAPWTDENAQFMLLNPTVFGNTAYIALNTKEPYASRARSALDFLKSKL